MGKEIVCDISRFIGEEYLNDESGLWEQLVETFSSKKSDQKIVILSFENGCLEYVGVLVILDKLCSLYDIDKSDILLKTSRHGVTYSEYKHKHYTNFFDNIDFADKKVDYYYTEKYKACCFFGRANSSRLFLWHYLKEFTDVKINFHQNFNKEYAAPTIKEFLKNVDISYFQLQEIFPFVEIGDEILEPPIVPGTNNNDDFFGSAYSNFAIEIVAETSPQYGRGYYFTEKSFRPFYYGMIPIIHCKPGSLKFFKRVGLDIFEDIIPTWYDQFSGLNRIEAIVKILSETKITKSDYDFLKPRFYKNTRKILQLQDLYKEKYADERLLQRRS